MVYAFKFHLVHGMPELREIAQKLLHTPHFFQAYIESSKGRDIRVIVVGGKVLGGMERRAQEGEFRSNIELGGDGRAFDLSEEYAKVAVLAANALGLDYCGVDLLMGKDSAIICEVNSNAFFEGLENATGYNVAKAYAKYIVDAMSKK